MNENILGSFDYVGTDPNENKHVSFFHEEFNYLILIDNQDYENLLDIEYGQDHGDLGTLTLSINSAEKLYELLGEWIKSKKEKTN